jgi:hypothetical protein
MGEGGGEIGFQVTNLGADQYAHKEKDEGEIPRSKRSLAARRLRFDTGSSPPRANLCATPSIEPARSTRLVGMPASAGDADDVIAILETVGVVLSTCCRGWSRFLKWYVTGSEDRRLTEAYVSVRLKNDKSLLTLSIR